jgi:hypothetical protein
MTRLVLAAAALLAALPFTASAQVPAERREIRHDRHELADSRWDVAQMQRLLARWDEARARRSTRALRAVEDDVDKALERELAESRAELMRSRAELRRDARDDRRDDHRDLRDDRRDVRDDRRDLRDDRRDMRRVEAVRAEMHALRGRMNPRSLDRKRALLVELTQMSFAELREDRGELREDRGELREDRREFRGDVRR